MEQQIKTSVDNDLSMSFASNTDAQLKSWFDESVNVDVDVTLSDLQKYLYADLPTTWADIKTSAAGGNITCIWLLELFTSKINEINVHHPAFIAQMDALVALVEVPSFTAADKAAILAMGTLVKFRYQILGVGREPQFGSIAMARNL